MGRSYCCVTQKIRRLVLLAGVLATAAITTGCGRSGREPERKGDLLRIALTSEPVLDPAKAFDGASGTVVLALFDSLVKLNADLQPAPNAASSWEVTEKGRIVTFHLRGDLRWSNGQALTARDYEFSWKRALSPEVEAGSSYELLGIAGAQRYSACKTDCEALEDRVGVHALSDRTLEVRLSAPQPWFVAQTAHWVFLPVHRSTVERYGDAWTEPDHIVTSGPYRLVTWKHNKSLTLARDQSWRDAPNVAVKRVELTVITDPAAQLKAFDSGSVDALDGVGPVQLPTSEIVRLQRAGRLAVYPGLGLYYLGINLHTIPDPIQRRAMALAIDRTTFAATAGPIGFPATSFTPAGLPGYDVIAPRFLDEHAQLSQARALMRKVKNPKRTITLYQNEHDPKVATYTPEITKDWTRIGISTKVRILEWASFLEQLGPPPSPKIDVYGLGWAGDYPDDTNFLGVWTCANENNFTGFCDSGFDRALADAARLPAAANRWKIYAKLEDELTGPNGVFPIIPMSWYAYVNLEAKTVSKTFNLVPPYGYADLSKVVVDHR